jgi:hypothetical protein
MIMLLILGKMMVIAQLRWNKDFNGFRAVRIDSNTDTLFGIEDRANISKQIPPIK